MSLMKCMNCGKVYYTEQNSHTCPHAPLEKAEAVKHGDIQFPTTAPSSTNGPRVLKGVKLREIWFGQDVLMGPGDSLLINYDSDGTPQSVYVNNHYVPFTVVYDYDKN